MVLKLFGKGVKGERERAFYQFVADSTSNSKNESSKQTSALFDEVVPRCYGIVHVLKEEGEEGEGRSVEEEGTEGADDSVKNIDIRVPKIDTGVQKSNTGVDKYLALEGLLLLRGFLGRLSS